MVSASVLAENAAQKENCVVSQHETFTADNVVITPQNIFDEEAENAIALHHWANSLHIVTKPFVIEERLVFQQGDEVSIGDLAEAEAILRREIYIANAQVEATNLCDATKPNTVTVTTQDNWSLVPTFSFGRSGGENSSLIGVRDSNLLGLGVYTQFRYTSDEQRSGYQLGFASAFHWVRHANVRLNLADNDDGERFQFVFNKPFYHVGTDTMQYAEVLNFRRVEDIFQNGETRNSLDIDQTFFRGAFGWNVSASQNHARRIIVGVDLSDTTFSFDAMSPSFNPLFLPEDREYQFPWVAYEFLDRNIKVKQDVRLIKQPEDINFGWFYRLQFGLETNDTREGSDFGYHLSASAERAFELSDWLFLFETDFRAILNTTAKDVVQMSSRIDAFYRYSNVIGYYARFSGDFSSGQFLDIPIAIDDDSGVRGYPNQYQHGAHRISASVETRFYTNYNVYQLFEVGFAGFFDIGRAFNGETAQFNEDDGILSSVGIGARFYSNKASSPGVVHLDITKPLTDGNGVDSLEWSVQFRRSF